MFTSQPQAVEVYQAGTWWAGELLGWRHDVNGSCQVWVRVVLGGVEETAWTELSSLRLPERHLTVAGGPPATPGNRTFGPATQEMSVARHPSGRRVRVTVADDAATAGLPAVRDLSVVPELSSPGGRRTADETAQFASVGRRRAPESVESPASGRRRAPETGETPAVGRRRAPDVSLTAGRPPVPPGRHRASGDPGRHRTADTDRSPTVTTGVGRPEGKGPRVPGTAVRPRVPVVPTEGASVADAGRPAVGADVEPELLTRPMRLTDHAPHARRPRVDGSLRRI